MNTKHSGTVFTLALALGAVLFGAMPAALRAQSPTAAYEVPVGKPGPVRADIPCPEGTWGTRLMLDYVVEISSTIEGSIDVPIGRKPKRKKESGIEFPTIETPTVASTTVWGRHTINILVDCCCPCKKRGEHFPAKGKGK